MNLKCVHCEGEAEYLVKGTSYCKEHLPTENKSQDTQVENFDILESRVNKAIKDGCPFEFDKYDIYQTKFMQKVAETWSSLQLGIYLTTIFFIAAVGVTFSVSVILAPPSVTTSEAIGKYTLFVIGIFLLIVAIVFVPKRKQHEACRKIILQAERRIQILTKEKENE